MPHLYTLMWEASTEHQPVLRPTFFDFGDDANTWLDNDEMMVGPDLLVAPVFEVVSPPHAVPCREVNMLEGWFDYWTGGSTSAARRSPSRRHWIVCCFVRAGALIPTTDGRTIWRETEDTSRELHYWLAGTSRKQRARQRMSPKRYCLRTMACKPPMRRIAVLHRLRAAASAISSRCTDADRRVAAARATRFAWCCKPPANGRPLQSQPVWRAAGSLIAVGCGLPMWPWLGDPEQVCSDVPTLAAARATPPCPARPGPIVTPWSRRPRRHIEHWSCSSTVSSPCRRCCCVRSTRRHVDWCFTAIRPRQSLCDGQKTNCCSAARRCRHRRYGEVLPAMGYAVPAIDHWCFGERSHSSERAMVKRLLWQAARCGAIVHDSLAARSTGR